MKRYETFLKGLHAVNMSVKDWSDFKFVLGPVKVEPLKPSLGKIFHIRFRYSDVVGGK